MLRSISYCLFQKEDATHHKEKNYMSYEEEQPGYEREAIPIQEDTQVKYARVLHLVHVWIQQCQKAKGNLSLCSLSVLSGTETIHLRPLHFIRHQP